MTQRRWTPMAMRTAVMALCLACTPLVGTAETSRTLADIRQDMTVLMVEMKKLRRELSTTGTAPARLSGSHLDRITSIEGELQRINGKIEELEFRIKAIVKDGTNRLGDLEYRLVELEGGDPAALADTTTLGGTEGAGAAAPAAIVAPAPQSGSAAQADLAMGEQADFDAAKAALAAGDGAGAAALFSLFLENYPGSPLESEARLQRGDAFEAAGNARDAARAYLDAYTSAPSGPKAGSVLYRLGRSLGNLGKPKEACVTLGEVALRHPESPAVAQAKAEMSRLGCQG